MSSWFRKLLNPDLGSHITVSVFIHQRLYIQHHILRILYQSEFPVIGGRRQSLHPRWPLEVKDNEHKRQNEEITPIQQMIIPFVSIGCMTLIIRVFVRKQNCSPSIYQLEGEYTAFMTSVNKSAGSVTNSVRRFNSCLQSLCWEQRYVLVINDQVSRTGS